MSDCVLTGNEESHHLCLLCSEHHMGIRVVMSECGARVECGDTSHVL